MTNNVTRSITFDILPQIRYVLYQTNAMTDENGENSKETFEFGSFPDADAAICSMNDTATGFKAISEEDGVPVDIGYAAYINDLGKMSEEQSDYDNFAETMFDLTDIPKASDIFISENAQLELVDDISFHVEQDNPYKFNVVAVALLREVGKQTVFYSGGVIKSFHTLPEAVVAVGYEDEIFHAGIAKGDRVPVEINGNRYSAIYKGSL